MAITWRKSDIDLRIFYGRLFRLFLGGWGFTLLTVEKKLDRSPPPLKLYPIHDFLAFVVGAFGCSEGLYCVIGAFWLLVRPSVSTILCTIDKNVTN